MVYGLVFGAGPFPPSLKLKPEICSELRKSSMSLGIGLLLNCSVCVCVCVRARNLPAKNASGALPNCWGPKKGPFLQIGHTPKRLGGELSPPPLTPRSLSSTSVQACSLLALSFPICYRHFWPDWILSALSRRPLVQEISPTYNMQRSRNGVCSGGVRRRDQQGGRRGGKVCVGRGKHLTCYLYKKRPKFTAGA